MAESAGATPPPALWQRCDGGEDDIGCGILRGVATAPVTAPKPGEVFVSEQGSKAVDEFTVWGEFVKTWGWDVIASGPGDNGTGFEICTPAAGDVCKPGVGGSGAGQFPPSSGPQGIAVDSAGSVYTVDKDSLRVQKFSSGGEFLRMWGGGVNSGTSGNSEICTDAGSPTDVCGAGSAGTGPGQFSEWALGSVIAVFTNATATVADDKVYVGDKGRIQVFNASGEFQSQITAGLTATERVQSLAVDVSGNLYAAIDGKNNVRKWNAAGTSLGEIFTVTAPRALALDGSKNLYVVSGSSKSVVRKFNSVGAEQKEDAFGQESPPTPPFATPTGIAVGSACFKSPNKEADIYVANDSPGFLRAYGAVPNNLALCPKPARPPNIAAQYPVSVGTVEAELRAQINPRFWADTTYYVQYATAGCFEAGGWAAACVEVRPAPPGSELGAGEVTSAVASKDVLLDELQPDTAYRFRFAAASGGGGPVFGVGGTLAEDGEDGAFHTAALPAGPPPADTCSNAQFRTGPGAFLVDCRAYEMVSPIDKEGGDILTFPNSERLPTALYQSSTAGSGLTYSSYRSFGGTASAPYTSQYIARRIASAGWSSEPISPAHGQPTVTPFGESEYQVFSDDLCSGWLIPGHSTAPVLAPAGVDGVPNLYRRSDCGAGAGGFEARGAGSQLELQGFSTDGSHAIIRTKDHLAQDAATKAGTQLRCQTTTVAKTFSYQWLRGGVPIPTATLATYTTTGEDEGQAVQCQVVAKNENAGATQIANPAFIVAPYPATPPPEAPVSIPAPSADAALGVGQAGEPTLTCDPNSAGWKGSPSFAYRWYRNGTAIGGATGASYVVQGADLASAATFQCEAIATNAGGSVAKVSENLLTSPAPSGPPAPLAEASNAVNFFAGSIYESTGEGELHTICLAPGSTVEGSGCAAGTAVNSSFNGRSQSVDHAISADGSRIFWTDSASNGQGRIYVRIGGEETTPVSQQGEEVSATSGSFFWGAAGDGSAVVFQTGGDLYRFDVDSKTTMSIAGEVVGIVGMSDDASRVYLVSREALSGGEENSEGAKAEAGEPNLYLYDGAGGGSFAFLATLSAVDAAVSTGGVTPTPVNLQPFSHVARVTPDGGAATFMSTASLTGYDNTDVNNGQADAEVFHYGASSGQLECVSCDPSGARPEGRNISFSNDPEKFSYWTAARIPGSENELYATRALSDDGTRLFFESVGPLVLRDTNAMQDVYEWEQLGAGSCGKESPAFSPTAGGCVSLVSAGKSPQDSAFVDASPSGDDVFIRTGSSLVPSDPGLLDIYDARVGGGFAEPAAEPPCEGDACQSPPPPPPEITPSSLLFQGAGDLTAQPRKHCARGKRLVVRKGKARCVKRKSRRARHDHRGARR